MFVRRQQSGSFRVPSVFVPNRLSNEVLGKSKQPFQQVTRSLLTERENLPGVNIESWSLSMQWKNVVYSMRGKSCGVFCFCLGPREGGQICLLAVQNFVRSCRHWHTMLITEVQIEGAICMNTSGFFHFHKNLCSGHLRVAEFSDHRTNCLIHLLVKLFHFPEVLALVVGAEYVKSVCFCWVGRKYLNRPPAMFVRAQKVKNETP